MKPIFTPTVDFWSEEFQSWYCKGLFYTVRNAKLATLAEQWEKEGKIVFKERPRSAGMNLQAEHSEARGTLVVGKGS